MSDNSPVRGRQCLTGGVQEYGDFTWTPHATLARAAHGEYPWRHYLQTAVELEADGQAGTVWPLAAHPPSGDSPPLGSLHVITAIQPGTDPASADNAARMTVLDHQLQAAGIASLRAAGVGFDGNHREESRAVFGLDDERARALGLRFGQVAIFAWRGPRWSLLACATDRQDHRGWRWQAR